MMEKAKGHHFEDGEDVVVRGWKLCFSNDINQIVKFVNLEPS
jgi:hypothetical protein